MAKTYTVTAALVVALVAGKVQHLYAGDVVPSNIDAASLDHLKAIGFVSASGSDEVEIPDGDPTDKWTVKQLEAFAARSSLDLGAAKSKPEILAALGVAPQA